MLAVVLVLILAGVGIVVTRPGPVAGWLGDDAAPAPVAAGVTPDPDPSDVLAGPDQNAPVPSPEGYVPRWTRWSASPPWATG
ncbi:hypothetical protein GCM10027614_52660 [Micromonospora vulcania]